MAAYIGGHTIIAMYVGTSPIALAYAGIIPAWSSEGIEIPDPDLIPDATSFLSVNDIQLNTLVVSEYILPTGFDTATNLTIVGGEYQISTGLWATAPTMINPGQPIRVRRNSSGAYNTAVQVIVTIGGVAMPFTVVTLQENVGDPDTTPNSINFTPVADAELDTLITSGYITPDGYDTDAPVTIIGGEYQIENGAWTNAAGTITPGADIRVRRNSSNEFATSVEVILTIGGVPMTFTISTRIADTIPDAAGFTSATDVSQSTLTTSGYITPTGYESPSTVTITGGEYQIESGAWVSTPGTLNPTQQIRVRGISSVSYDTTTQVVLTVGGVAMVFSITTAVEAVGLAVPVLTLNTGINDWSVVMPDLQDGDTVQLDFVAGGANPDGVAEESQVVDARDLELNWATFTGFAADATVKWTVRYGRQVAGVWEWSQWGNVLTAVAPPLWTPSNLSVALRHMYHAEDAYVTPNANMSAITTIIDQGSAAQNATQTNPPDRITYVHASNINGKRAFRVGTSSGNFHMDIAASDWGGLSELSTNGDLTSILAGTFGRSGFASLITPCVISIVWTPTTIDFYQNGLKIGATGNPGFADSGTAFAVVDLASAGNFGFGRWWVANMLFNRSSFARGGDGDFRHLSKASYAMTAAERQKMEGWLAHDSNIALTAGHPHQASPPTQ